MEALLLDPLRRLFEDIFSPAVVRELETGAAFEPVWSRLEASGYLDALVPETHGGFGLALGDACDAFELCGYFAVSLPVGQTMLARALAATLGLECPDGPLVLAGIHTGKDGTERCHGIEDDTDAPRALVLRQGKAAIMPVPPARGRAGAESAAADDRVWTPDELRSTSWAEAQGLDAITLLACVLAAQLSGAMTRVFELTLHHANERSQFGRPLGKFQVIQHQISMMAEHVATAKAAARVGCRADSAWPDSRRVAVAKAVTSRAAPPVVSMAHAIHGAIGISEEFDLQLYTRRMRRWRSLGGTELYWHRYLGRDLLASGATHSLDYILGA